MDTNQLSHCQEQASPSSNLQARSLSSTTEGSSDIPNLQLKFSTTATITNGTHGSAVKKCSLDQNASHTRDYRDEKRAGKPGGSKNQAPAVTAMSTSELYRAEKLKTIECLRPTIDTVLCRASQSGCAKTKSNLQQPINSKRVRPPLDKSQHQISQQKDGSSDNKPTTGLIRLIPDEDLLAVPRLYADDDESPRCPRCRWTLLTRPLNPSGVPVISVTDPGGVVRYPYDHTYYSNGSVEDDSSDDSDYSD
ncbi:hypothetical protein F4804DRAFT_352421 [Jackrogersella minutella]|nr:hypothetical protein F4804DRAFT_352421 [Jackrogersella minutella]